MIEFTTGNILEANAEALVNTVNCVGVMGRGIALQFRNSYPENYRAYVKACERGEVEPGKMFVFETKQLSFPRYIINFPTKRHWRGKSRLVDIASGLEALSHEIQLRGIHSIAIPPLGSGLGGLDWDDVRPLIERMLSDLPDVTVIVYEPHTETVELPPQFARDVPKMTPGRAALVGLIDRYLRGFLDPQVTLLEVQKLMYFMQYSGEPLRLQYVKHHYGPYASNLRHVLRDVEGYFLTGYKNTGDRPYDTLEIVPGALEDALAFLFDKPQTLQRFERVTELVNGFESPFGLELLATVHWVTDREGARSLGDTVGKVHAWNRRKRMFSERQIAIAYDDLEDKGWLTK
jgi:O-acetyl-ADP-ribose deacetylase (regulator of RNase III)